MKTKNKIKTQSYVQIMIDIKERLSLKYYQDPEQLMKELKNIRKKYGLKTDEPIKIPI